MQIEEFGRILQANGFAHGAGVPCSYFKPLVNYMTVEPNLDYMQATSEGEAVAIASGLVAAGKPAFVLMQNSGLGNAVNPITSLVYIYQIPVALFVSQRGQPGLADEPQHELMGRITKELAELCDLRTHLLEPSSFAAELASAQTDATPAAWICRKGTLEGGPKAPPVTPTLRSAAVTPGNTGEFVPIMRREEAVLRILPLLNRGLNAGQAPVVVSTTGKLSRELYELDDREHDKANRFYMVGSMGCAAGFGLGIARARPDRKVLVLDGDGAVLMKMGTLATAGAMGTHNFHHVVFDNAAYESTGGQRTASPTVDFATVALACGYRMAETVAEPDALEPALARHLGKNGPTLLRVVIKTGARKDLGRPNLGPKGVWKRFTQYIQS
ncbi:MAG: phosphonopyruvate decarboxylase [Deltaproteobacteria bacterium RIFOXYB12_FULL_58_9]|nr:MAG: phosphonopyruvate decarboxylase [Deltaproteobacteria bacterium RIFOXYB12_FULL_58_9]